MREDNDFNDLVRTFPIPTFDSPELVTTANISVHSDMILTDADQIINLEE
jgi:hypothetical protein